MAKILVVDDNHDNRQILSRLLQFSGHEVTTADGGQSGLESARANPPDLILMDLEMPEIDGWTATLLIKAEPPLVDVPVIAVSGYVTHDEIERAQESGCVDVIPKPVELDVLIRKVDQHLPARVG